MTNTATKTCWASGLGQSQKIEIPPDSVANWQYEVANGDTIRGLADWYIAGDETRDPRNADRKPLGYKKAKTLAESYDSDFVTVTVLVDKEQILFTNQEQAEDNVHNHAFAFGSPCGATLNIIDVIGGQFMIEYTTDLSEFLDRN